MLNTDIQAKWGPIFYVYLVKRAARTPVPVSYATWSKHLHFAQLIFVLVINFVNICQQLSKFTQVRDICFNYGIFIFQVDIAVLTRVVYIIKSNNRSLPRKIKHRIVRSKQKQSQVRHQTIQNIGSMQLLHYSININRKQKIMIKAKVKTNEVKTFP